MTRFPIASRIPLIAVLLATCLASLFSAGCFLTSAEQRALDDARSLWQQAGVSHYEFYFRRSCFCGDEVTQEVKMEVDSGVVVSLTYAATGMPVDAQYRDSFETVAQMFDTIQDAIDRGADDIDVAYDPDYGYPREISIDYWKNAADDEMSLSGRDLTPL